MYYWTTTTTIIISSSWTRSNIGITRRIAHGNGTSNVDGRGRNGQASEAIKMMQTIWLVDHNDGTILLTSNANHKHQSHVVVV